MKLTRKAKFPERVKSRRQVALKSLRKQLHDIDNGHVPKRFSHRPAEKEELVKYQEEVLKPQIELLEKRV